MEPRKELKGNLSQYDQQVIWCYIREDCMWAVFYTKYLLSTFIRQNEGSQDPCAPPIRVRRAV